LIETLGELDLEVMQLELICGDNLEWAKAQPADSIDLVFGSPPYEDARTYGIGFKIRGREWVDWMVQRWMEWDRICRGLVAMVVEGKTRAFRWSATPAYLMAELDKRGVKLRKPPAFCRVGIPGGGGPDWLRNDYEFVVCSTKGKLPWSDNTAMGHAPKWAPGGPISHRTKFGTRVNGRDEYGFTPRVEPSETQRRAGASARYVQTKRRRNGNGRGVDGMHNQDSAYLPPVKANPGNLIKLIVGGGVMGHKLCHENEAPFPEALAEWFIRSFCPPGGTVLDPFVGSGTTAAVALMHGRNAIGIDVRQEQIDLARRRIASQVAFPDGSSP